jgi:demethylmenaquinone methyltransferase/2-methoxy-6-polyprenyl-1,4-benzoquinol methylase
MDGRRRDSGPMANKFYEAGAERAERVNDLFAAVAPRYDLINDLQSFGLHRWWKRRLVRLAQVSPGSRALDLCCGTGDVSFALETAGAEVTGLDFSAPMLAVARRRACRRSSGPGPEFVQGDAMALPFPDASFDVVTVSYGLRNLSDWSTGLTEMFRVAKPGGRVLVLDFGKPDDPWLRAAYFFYLKRFVPIFGKLFCGDGETHAYILESLHHYPAQRGVEAAMLGLDARAVRVVNLLGGVMSLNLGVKAY